MATVESKALEFVRRKQSGGTPRVVVPEKHAAPFLAVLREEGFSLAEGQLEKISNSKVREIVQSVFFSTTAFAIGGAAVGHLVGGPKGMKVGAAVGAGIGFAVGGVAVAYVLRLEERGEGLIISAD